MEKIVNHAVADSLDSSGAFEGPEKLLRLVFTGIHGTATGDTSLLQVPRSDWEAMLDLVHCKVLSVVRGEGLHAYLLSESSMFVYAHQLVLKTCGTTTLLEGLEAILAAAAKQGLGVEAAFYSRRSFLFPQRQPHPHNSWADEVARLRHHWPVGTTAQFGAGPEQRWHLFAYVPAQFVPAMRVGWSEMMMTRLDPERASRFWHPPEDSLVDSVLSLDSECGAEPDDDDPGHRRGNVMTRTTGIDELYARRTLVADSFAFSPCGYSCNGIIAGDSNGTPSDRERYITIHVTPEDSCSYASFESTVPRPTSELVGRVLDVFGPEQFALVGCNAGEGADDALPHCPTLAGGAYVCTSEARIDLGPLVLTHMTFVRSSGDT